jgi:hypothetical protein
VSDMQQLVEELARRFDHIPQFSHALKRYRDGEIKLPQVECNMCNDTGMVNLGNRDRESIVPCMYCEKGFRKTMRFIERLHGRSGFGKFYQTIRIANFADVGSEQMQGKELAYALAAEFVAKRNHPYDPECINAIFKQFAVAGKIRDEDSLYGLSLTGGYGRGKTALMIAILNEFVWRWELDVGLHRLADVVERVQSTYTQRAIEVQEADIWAGIAGFKYYFLDECYVYGRPNAQGENVPTPDHQRIFKEILHCRQGKPTVITSNFTQSEFLRMWGDHIADRVFADMLTVEMTGPSLRHPYRAVMEDRS